MGKESKLFNAAVNLIFEKGYRGASLSRIAEEVGIKKASLYYYFRSKEDLLYWIFMYIGERIRKDFLNIRAREKDPVKRIENFVKCYLRYIAEDSKSFQIFLVEKRELSESRKREVEKICDLLYHLMKEAIVEAQIRGALASHFPSDLVTFFIFGAMNGVVVWFSPEGKYSIDEIAEVYIDFIFKALRTCDAGQDV